MKAAVRNAAGGVITMKENYSQPTSCGSKEVLIDVKAAAINPVDYKLPGWPVGNTIVGFDVAGVVKSVGSKVTSVQVGDEVYGSANGALAQVAVAKAEDISKKSTNLSFVEAAALPVAYLTSLQSLRDYGKMSDGSRVLVIGASGGCGLAALQIAKALGAKDIVAVCSGRNEALVREHGATEVVDYTKTCVLEHHSDKEGNVGDDDKFDVVYDAATGSGAGEDYKDKSIALLKKDGQYVAINGSPMMWMRTFTIGHKKNQHLMLCKRSAEDLDFLSKLADDGKIRPVLAETLPFTNEDLQKGFELLKSRRATGKIVFDLTQL